MWLYLHWGQSNNHLFKVLSRIKFLSTIQLSPSGTVIGITITVQVVSIMLLIFACMLRQSFLKLGANNLFEVHSFTLPYFGLGLTCTPMTFEVSAFFVKMMTIACVVAFEWAPICLA